MSQTSPRGVIVVDHAHLKEFFDADDKVLDNIQGLLEENDFRYTTRASLYSTFHINVIRNQLTQHIASMMPDIIDELSAVLGEDLDLLVKDGIRSHLIPYYCRLDFFCCIPEIFENCGESKSKGICWVSIMYFSFQVVRMLRVGRNEEYIKFSADHAVTVNKVSQRLTMWPKILRP